MVDKEFCMSSYLMYRYVYNKNISFSNDFELNIANMNYSRKPVKTASDLLDIIEETVNEAFNSGKTALALSGGMDSAIIAKFMPKKSKAVTFNCIVPGIKTFSEVQAAKYWAEQSNLDHEVIDIYWDDVERATDLLIRSKGAPIHSIEPQIYLAAKKLKDDGFENFIFGENADIIFGGMNGLLEKDWYFSEFVERYSYILPYKVLRNPKMPLAPFQEFEKDGHIDGHEFINKYFRQESLGSYLNACKVADINFVGPFTKTYLDEKINYERIRSGDTKYIIREAFKKLYPNNDYPKKVPMPRPVNEWFANWEGPTHPAFLPHCIDNLTGNQRWMVWCLEKFLNLIEN